MLRNYSKFIYSHNIICMFSKFQCFTSYDISTFIHYRRQQFTCARYIGNKLKWQTDIYNQTYYIRIVLLILHGNADVVYMVEIYVYVVIRENSRFSSPFASWSYIWLCVASAYSSSSLFRVFTFDFTLHF